MSGTLMMKTQQLLKQREDDVTLLRIYNDLGIPPGWVQKFMANKFPNPSVNRVQRLYEYLTGTPLIV